MKASRWTATRSEVSFNHLTPRGLFLHPGRTQAAALAGLKSPNYRVPGLRGHEGIEVDGFRQQASFSGAARQGG
jgi:hypothetical protein